MTVLDYNPSLSSTCVPKPMPMPSNYFDEQYQCILQSMTSAPEKIRNNLPVIADCHPSDLTRQQCSSTDGSFCPYQFSIIINFPGATEDFRSTVEVCVPNGCTIDDLKELEKYWNDKFSGIFNCKSPDSCANAKFTLQCPALVEYRKSELGSGINGWGIFLAVVILVLISCIGGTAFYIYKKKQENPEIPVSEVLNDMPPIRSLGEAFSSAREGIANRWTQLSQEDNTYG